MLEDSTEYDLYYLSLIHVKLYRMPFNLKTGHFFILQQLSSLWCQCYRCGLHRTIAFFNPYHTRLQLGLLHTTCEMGTGVAYGFGPLGVHHLCHTGYTYVVLLPYLLLSKKQKLTLTSWLLFLKTM